VKSQGEQISIRVRPRSSRRGLRIGTEGEVVVCVHASASEGNANRECVAVLAEAVGVAKSRVRIVRGEKSRSKRIAVEGIGGSEVRALLEQSAEAQERAR
jgi:uncharacterized protein (TIGR00251 family)